MRTSLTRRRFLVGTAAAGAAGPAAVTGLALSGVGPAHAQTRRTPAPGKLGQVYQEIGNYILLAPTKFMGGVYALDLGSGKTLAWLAPWNYGDTNPIMHHLAAFPAPDPYKEFEFIVNTQGGKNLFIYGIPTKVKEPGEGFRIYRIRYDGTKLNLVEDVAETTGLGLGVHVTIAPDAKSFAVADGQKDVAAIVDRATSKVLAALAFDWQPRVKTLKEAWTGGGTLTVKKIHPDPKTGKFDLQGTKGIKIDWELVPGGELFIEDGKVPGQRPTSVVGLDAVVFDPRGQWAVASLRTVGLGVVLDRQKDYAPVAVLAAPKGAPDQVPVAAVGKETWKAELDRVLTPAHQAGFSPTGEHFVFMNGVRQNNVAVFDSKEADPARWQKKAFVEHPEWRGAYPNAFHMVFTPDAKKLYVTLWWPAPTPNGVAVIDAVSWKVLKTIDVGPDMHTLSVTYDGKHMVGVFSGYQKTESGIFILDARSDEPVGYLPSPGGHHDSVIVPRTLEELRVSRSTTT
jgi:hypothetical protein